MSDQDVNGQSDLQFLDALNTAGDLYLIRQTTTGRILTGRRVNVGQAEIYRRLQRLHAPHTPQIRDLREEVDGSVLVLEDYISGNALSVELQKGLYNARTAAGLAGQLCDALMVLHRAGLVHRDIKPENVIVTAEGQAYLIDFDITRVQKSLKSHDTVMMGTTGYAAPEQYGFTQTDARADIYALGVLLNQMVTGAFPQDHLAAAPLGTIIQKCTALDPANRYQSAAALRQALQYAGAGRTTAQPQFSRHRNSTGVPGFRTGNVWHEVVAVLFYAVALIFGTALLYASFQSVRYFFIGIPLLVGTIGTFLFLFDVFALRTRCQWTETSRNSNWYWLRCMGVVLQIWGGCLAVMVVSVIVGGSS